MASAKNIYLLIGEDILKEEFIEDLISKHIPEEAREFNVDFLSGEEITVLNLIQRANTLPLFSPHRVIIVKGIEKLKRQEQEKLADMLEQIPSSTILVLSATSIKEMSGEFLKKIKGFTEERSFLFPDGKSRALQQRKLWIQQELRKKGGSIEPDALDVLAEAPMELRQLRGEIDKLYTYAQGRTIKLEDVRTVMTATQDVKVYEFTDAVFGGRGVEAMSLLNHLLETGDLWTPLIIVHNLASQARLLLQVKILQDRGIPLLKENRKEGRVKNVLINQEELPSTIKKLLLEGDDNLIQYLQKRYWLGEKLQTQARMLSKSSIYTIIRLLHTLDIEIKQGADPRGRLEWFILKVAGVTSSGGRSSDSG